jgi:hypothetical protein
MRDGTVGVQGKTVGECAAGLDPDPERVHISVVRSRAEYVR